MSTLGLLTVVFITLKVVDKIDWSWWLVLSPTLLQIALIAFIVFAKTMTR